jgi:hypothetical protein
VDADISGYAGDSSYSGGGDVRAVGIRSYPGGSDAGAHGERSAVPSPWCRPVGAADGYSGSGWSE